MGVRLGNGNWAVKTSKLLAYNDASGMFFNKEFDFTRATTATRVNKSGLIESVASNLPRVDFLNDSKGHLLLEPASTNTATYSNDFTQGDIFSGSADPSLSDAILTANQGTAPDGTNTAQLLKDDSDGATGQSRLNYFAANVLSGEFNTASVFAKKYSNNDFFRIEVGGYDSGFPSVFFNIQSRRVLTWNGGNRPSSNPSLTIQHSG